MNTRAKTGFIIHAACALLISWAGTALGAGDPVKIGFTLEGCNLDHGGVFYESTLMCSDDGYTTGNLGKEWSELDLVPHRMTLSSGNSSSPTFTFIVAGDYSRTEDEQDVIGWDYISGLTLNAAKSLGVCDPHPVLSPITLTPAGEGAGGVYRTIYRTVTIEDMGKNATCVYDYNNRLAIGSSLYTGSSLQSNLWNQSLTTGGIGQKRIQLPVPEKSQQVAKDMTAVQDVANTWNLLKGPMPATINFGDTCDPANTLAQPVQFTVEWSIISVDPRSINVVP
ncbi:hypothetical protein FDZ71_18495, partial [bacterium]